MKRFLFLVLAVFAAGTIAFAGIPIGYYDASDSKTTAELKTAMHKIVHKTISMDFDGFTATYWGDFYYKKTDWNPAGYYWDMYSNEQRVKYNSSNIAREHCMPRSWWGNASDYGQANSDLHNLYPSDNTANSKKSNLPLGVASGGDAWTNGVVKVGANFYSGYSGKVFEPADEYKGDFARTYFYMVCCYEDYADRWKNDGITSMLENTTYPVFQTWAINMLLNWCRQDPVSQKETNRNDSVFSLQQNRNPFIDFPGLEEYIWGNKKGQSFTITNKATQPALITPAKGTKINFGQARTTKTRSVPLRGILLTADLTIEFVENPSGYFKFQSDVACSVINQPEGGNLILTYSPGSSFQSHTAKLQISSNSSEFAPVIIELEGSSGSSSVSIPPVEPAEDMDVIIFHRSPNNSWIKASLPDNFETNSNNAPYANGDFSFKNSKEYLTVTFDEQADVLQFSMYPRNAWGENENHLYVYEGTSNTSFDIEPVADFDNEFVTVSSYNNAPRIPLKANTRAIKIEYIKQAQNVGINNLIIAKLKSIAVNNNNSNNTENGISVYSHNNNLYIDNLNLGENFTIYNSLGVPVVAEIAVNTQMVIPFCRQGLFVLNASDNVVKFVVK